MPPPALTASAGTSAAAKCWPWPRDLELLPARAGNGAPHALQAPVFAAFPFFGTCRSWNVCPLCSSFGSRGLVDKELAAGAGDSRLDSWAALYRAEIAGSASATAPPAICHSSDPPRTRAWNLRLQGPTPYPLGQRTHVNFWLRKHMTSLRHWHGTHWPTRGMRHAAAGSDCQRWHICSGKVLALAPGS